MATPVPCTVCLVMTPMDTIRVIVVVPESVYRAGKAHFAPKVIALFYCVRLSAYYVVYSYSEITFNLRFVGVRGFYRFYQSALRTTLFQAKFKEGDFLLATL